MTNVLPLKKLKIFNPEPYTKLLVGIGNTYDIEIVDLENEETGLTLFTIGFTALALSNSCLGSTSPLLVLLCLVEVYTFL